VLSLGRCDATRSAKTGTCRGKQPGEGITRGRGSEAGMATTGGWEANETDGDGRELAESWHEAHALY